MRERQCIDSARTSSRQMRSTLCVPRPPLCPSTSRYSQPTHYSSEVEWNITAGICPKHWSPWTRIWMRVQGIRPTITCTTTAMGISSTCLETSRWPSTTTSNPSKYIVNGRSLMVVVLSRVLPQALHSEELGSDVLYAWGLRLLRPTVPRLFGSRSLQSLYMDETWRSLLQAVRFFCIEYEGWNECVESNGDAALRHLSVTHLHPANGE